MGRVSAEGLSRKRRLKVLSELQRCNSGLRSGKKKEKKKKNFCYECIASWRRFFYFSSAIVLWIRYFFPISSVYHAFSPLPLAVINPSIVPLTAEHASYACLFRAEELIMTSQQGPYRRQYMWRACDTMGENHAKDRGYELYCCGTHNIAGNPNISR